MAERKRVFSGIQPTGELHLGNYLGALRRWVDLQDEHECFFCIVDLHALTAPWNPAGLREQTLAASSLLIACGIDPDRSTLFVQSHVPAHAELAWILQCLTRMGELRRMVQFKEKSKGESESVGVGLFTYPVLQAADVLLYGAHGVPVGEDQRQHIELMRDLALRFNSRLGDTFVLPEPWIAATGARIMALDDPAQKMSKSAARPASSIQLLDEPEVILKKCKAAVTDSGRAVKAAPDKPALTNLLTIFSLLEGVPIGAVEDRFEGKGYGDFKTALAEVISDHLAPVRHRYAELMEDRDELARLLADGAERAAKVAEDMLRLVRDRSGLVPPA
jgi:tryptophanyl-tRNA synthetase